MSTEMTVAFIVLAVWSAVFTAAYIGERYRNRKLRQALKNRGRYARYKESRPLDWHHEKAAHEKQPNIF